MRQEVSTSGLAILDGATLPTKHGHPGSTAAVWAAVTREYQSDSSSKKPLRPLVFCSQTPGGDNKHSAQNLEKCHGSLERSRVARYAASPWTAPDCRGPKGNCRS